MRRNMMMGVVSILLITPPAQAQGIRPQFGIEAGAALATLTGDEDEGVKTKVAPYFGLSAIVQRPASMLGLQTGLFYVSRGAKFEESGSTGSLKLGYVELPIMLRIAPVTKSGAAVPAFFAGPSLAFRTGCKLEAEGISVECDDFAELKSFDFGVTLGGEVAIPAGRQLFIVPSVRFTQSVTSISDEQDTSVKNRTIQIGVGLRRHR